MKKILMALSMVLMLVPGVMADTVTLTGTGGDHAGFGPFQSGSGGEFTMSPTGSIVAYLDTYVDGVTKNILETQDPNKANLLPNFQTFCLEFGEGISAYATYNATVSDKAINGGVGPAGDPLSVGAAWLYHEFQLGTLAGYDYGLPYAYPYAGRKASALDLQQTIWWLEGEIAVMPVNVFSNAVIAQFANPKADNAGQIPVKVLNLTVPGTRIRAQDVLICVPETVPEPGTLLLLGIGLVGLAGFARKKFKK